MNEFNISKLNLSIIKRLEDQPDCKLRVPVFKHLQFTGIQFVSPLQNQISSKENETVSHFLNDSLKREYIPY